MTLIATAALANDEVVYCFSRCQLHKRSLKLAYIVERKPDSFGRYKFALTKLCGTGTEDEQKAEKP